MNTIQRGRPSFHIFRVLKIKVAKRLTGNKITSVPPKAEDLSCYKIVIPRGWHINICGEGMSNETHFPLSPCSLPLWYSLYPHSYCQSVAKEAGLTFRNAVFFQKIRWGRDHENDRFLHCLQKGNRDMEPGGVELVGIPGGKCFLWYNYWGKYEYGVFMRMEREDLPN